MLKYLIIPLSDNAVSFCHYSKGETSGKLIDLETLKEGIFWAMKENLNVQFLYPDAEVPDDYKRVIDSIDHAAIVGCDCPDEQLKEEADIIVFDNWEPIDGYHFEKGRSYVLRTDKDSFFEKATALKEVLKKVGRLVVVITNPQDFTEEDFEHYREILEDFIPTIVEEYRSEHTVQFNLLTDRLLLDTMNNCNAGDESITLAPDGKFYICPAFYLSGNNAVGDLATGPDIKNPQLYRLDHAPICRICDAYQCRRCVWLNKLTTLEVNTPSHEQCVMAHIERNASQKLLEEIRKYGVFLPEKEIKDINYLDPFDKIIEK